MSIIKTLQDKNMSDDEKLEAVSKVVAAAREAYGNEGLEIAVSKVNTGYGALPFDQIEDESKVEILLSEAMNIKAKAIAYVENNPGAVLNKKVQESLATNMFFANVSVGTKFDYL